MPLYEYTDGEHVFEKLVKLDERDDKQVCPRCGQIADRVVVSSSPAHGHFLSPGFTRRSTG